MSKLLVALLSVTFFAPQIFAQALAPAQDVVIRIDGSREEGRVIGADEQFIRVQRVVEQGTVMTSVPRAEVARVEFATAPQELAFIEKAGVPQAASVRQLWEQRRGFLNVPGSTAAAIGIAYGNLLLQIGGDANIEAAFQLFRHIEQNAGEIRDRVLAQQSRLRAMIAQGRVEEASKEAAELARTADEPLVLLEANYILAEASFDELRELIEENPRWEEDDLVRPRRNELYHKTLDTYLYPYLFHGAEEVAAARGLWGAVQTYKLGGEQERARKTARDIIVLYPNTPQAKLAREEFGETETPAEKT